VELEGFVLTSHWRDTLDGIVITLWLSTPRGPARVRVTRERAVMFVERRAAAQAEERKPVELATLAGAPVDALYFRRQAALQDERARLQHAGVQTFESDVRPAARFLMERFITGGCRVSGQERMRRGFVDFVNPVVRRGDHRPALSSVSIDIETDGIEGPVISIAAVGADFEQVLMQGRGPAHPAVRYFPDERTLLEAFFALIGRDDPDALIGWNVVEFDLTHLQARAAMNGLALDLGRGGERAAVLLPRSSGQLPVVRVPGRVVIDGIGTLKAATWSFERFGLDDVAQELLGRGKRIAETGDPIAEIQRMHRDEPLALAEYNLEDCRLVRDIFTHSDLISFAIARQEMSGLPMDRLGGSVAAFDHLYLPRLHRQGFVAPDVGAERSTIASPGGYVLPSQPGLYQNVVVLDFKSLYPSIIRTFHVDPLAMAVAGEDAIDGFEGARFARARHILPDLIATLWRERDRAKACDNAALSTSIKILMNSFYGVLGTPGCRFFSPLLASSITLRGHEIITASRDFIEREQGWRVIYGDTDSLFVLIGPGESSEAARAIGEELARSMNDWWRKRLATEQRLESCLEMELDACYARFFMPTLRGSDEGSAKRYAGLAEGDTLVVKGLEAVRTDWTALARRFQRELLRRVFHDEGVEPFVRDTRAQLFAGELDGELVYRKRLRRESEDYLHNVPPHVKAARMLDRQVREVHYVWTTRGPQPLEKRDAPLDYHHYVERQLGPASEALLACLGTSFDAIAGSQLRLF
jgi:DNA polymerase-2